jgi:ubiquinone/menaquinone biosynthesis C-methylase UbiE
MSLRDAFMAPYWYAERRLVPGLTFSQHLYENVLSEEVRPGELWLDVGCGRAILPQWRAANEAELVRRSALLVGIDYDILSLRENRSAAHRCRAELGGLPFCDATFELATANMVVEHLAEPQVQFSEIARVLRRGGRLIVHTPNSWGYPTVLARLIPDAPKRLLIRLLEGRAGKDVFPAYYRANTEAALRRLAQSTGFQVERLQHNLTTALTAVFFPLAVFELLLLRVLRSGWAARFRPSLIAVLRKT